MRALNLQELTILSLVTTVKYFLPRYSSLFFSGDIDEEGKLDLRGFLGRHRKVIRQPEMFACAGDLKQRYRKVGAVGYCWGGWGCFQLGDKDQNLIGCLTVAHPSHLENHEIDALAVPTQILAPGK